jgi:transglutaminase-like putative cysteine protease/chorismate mutase
MAGLKRKKAQKLKSSRVKRILLVFFLFGMIFIGNIYAQEEALDPTKLEYLEIEIKNEIEFGLDLEPDYRIEFFEIYSNFLPSKIEETQYLNNFTTSRGKNYQYTPEGTYKLTFPFEKNELKSNNKITNQIKIQKTKYFPKIKNKQQYPVSEEIKDLYSSFLEFDDTIDTNSIISEEAAEIVYGKDDTYEIAIDVANWIEDNIEYDLKTVYELPNQKATEVFLTRKGVCKEITRLYVSMMRTMGIPTRIVTGYAYTNSEDVVEYVGSAWGGHTWAEVLIDEQWVPIDITYKQYGYVDPSHIILDRDTNINTESVSINASGSGLQITKDSLKNTNQFEILDSIENLYDDNKIKVRIGGTNEISFLSYGYINASITNMDDYYKVIKTSLYGANQVDIDYNDKYVILKPEEKKNLIMTYKMNAEDKKGTYIFPFVTVVDDEEYEFNVTVSDVLKTLTENDLPQIEDGGAILSNNNIKVNCNINAGFPNKIICEILNPNNYKSDEIYICLEDVCETKSLQINERTLISFETKKDLVNVKYIYNETEKSIPLKLNEPSIQIEHEMNEKKIMLDVKIENFNENQKLVLYNDDKIIKSAQSEHVIMNGTLSTGTHTIKAVLLVENQTYEEKSFEVVSREDGFMGTLKLWWANFINWLN